MTYMVSKYPPSTFSWADVFSTDMPATSRFLTKLFGWKAKQLPTDRGVDYTMFYLDGKEVAGGSPMPPEMGDQSFWSSYITVDS